MVFPTPAVLFWAWFILTPLIRIGLRMFAHNLGPNARILVAYLSAFVIILGATAIALSAEELAGMAVMFAIGQAAFFVLDFMRMRPDS
jgi:hypothetical protein